MVKSPPAMQETWVWSLDWEDLLEKGTTTPGFWSEEFHEQRSLMGYNPWCHKELDMTEWLSLSLNIYKYMFISVMDKNSDLRGNAF